MILLKLDNEKSAQNRKFLSIPKNPGVDEYFN